MILAESEPETRSVRECRVEAVCEIPPITPEFLAIVRKEAARSRPGLRLRRRLRRVTLRRTKAKKQVCTMCTPRAPDSVVPVPDGAGSARFAGEWRIFKGWSPVRVPPRARVSLFRGL
jgi:hypothetical protein